MADENDIANGILEIARANGGFCSFNRAYKEIPNYVKLDENNLSMSITRPGEPMWYQLVRNIKSHSHSEGNFIHDGILIHVPRKGYKVS